MVNKTIADHSLVVENISVAFREYSSSHKDKKLRFEHGSTNSTRDQSDKDKYYFIDISNLDDVLEVNTEHMYALVEPNVSMDKLAKLTLEYGLIPPVVMEFPGITAGGAVNGATLEASSFRYGQFNDNCVEYEVILGNGEIKKISKNENEDLFNGLSGSYGSLCLITLIKVKLIPSKPYVKTVFSYVTGYKNTIDAIDNLSKDKNIDFVDAIILNPNDSVVVKGYFHSERDEKVETFSKSTDEWFYEKTKEIVKNKKENEEIIPIYDFLFRYNRGAYWMGDYIFPLIHIPDDRITKTILNPLMNTRKLYDGLHAANISQDFFIQDFYCPIENSEEFLKESENKLGIFPIWLCPMRPAVNDQKLSPSYLKTDLIIDIGIWGQSDKYLKDKIGLNREFEKVAKRLKSRKMLYAHAYYSEEEFWGIYDKEWYAHLRKKYFADKIFPDVWQKTHVGKEKYKSHLWRGMFKVAIDSFKGKNMKVYKNL